MGKPPSSAATSTSTPSATKPQDAAADPAKDHAKPAEPVDADTANNSLHTQPEPEHLDIPEPKSESEPAASRRTMLPPPSASETQALVHGHRSQARRPSPRTPTPPLALPVSAEPLDVVAMGGVSGRKGALDAKERVKAIQVWNPLALRAVNVRYPRCESGGTESRMRAMCTDCSFVLWHGALCAALTFLCC
eukprot:623303-Rhodomonas_salina.1